MITRVSAKVLQGCMPRSFMCVVAKHVSAKKMIFRSSQLVVSLPRSGYCRGIIIISMELLHCTCLVLQLSFCKKICGVVEKFQLFSQAIGICLSDTTINFCLHDFTCSCHNHKLSLLKQFCYTMSLYLQGFSQDPLSDNII